MYATFLLIDVLYILPLTEIFVYKIDSDYQEISVLSSTSSFQLSTVFNLPHAADNTVISCLVANFHLIIIRK